MLESTIAELYRRYPELKGLDAFAAGAWVSKNWSGQAMADDMDKEAMFRHMVIDIVAIAKPKSADSGPTPGPSGNTGE